ncbi:MAG: hypothetical protein GWP05_03910 [Anaerolineaceae bacterium]|nr:hypothetical protein [Anaerolineaceae bacterium]
MKEISIDAAGITYIHRLRLRSHSGGAVSARSVSVRQLPAADEIGTAVPGVDYYVSPGEGSLSRLLAEGLRRKATRGGPRAVVYVAENHNRAAEILESHTLGALRESERETVRPWVRFLNTVIGKMSGVVSDPEQIKSQQLAPVTPGANRALLVEEFNRTLISRIAFDDSLPEPGFQPGITVFEQKDDLLPFSEAKLYGHNATHALAAYVGAMLGLRHISDLAQVPGAMQFLRTALIGESGATLIRKYRAVDPIRPRGDGWTAGRPRESGGGAGQKCSQRHLRLCDERPVRRPAEYRRL